ncbi:hypothetical protein JW935_27430 [candidate division KSB1 bacterium]|nr:hypothetical protein [candidate division KSB1 bacterium]
MDQFVSNESGDNLKPSDTSHRAESGILEGYTDIVPFRDKFTGVGTDGRIDNISISGERVPVDFSNKYKLNCAFSNDKILIVAGDHGTILYSYDGTCFYHAEPATDKNINGITCKNGLILAGTDEGTMLISKDGKSWSDIQTKTKGNILSLSANKSFFIGITDAGEILKSTDGQNWEIKNYNKEYAGYNRYSKFKKILATQNSIVIIGTHDDGSPSILFSTLGNVWAERLPFYHDDEGKKSYLTKKPNGITYDPDRDQFFLACDNGGLFILPTCTKCNEYVKISEENLNAIIYANNCLIMAGDEFSVYIQRI